MCISQHCDGRSSAIELGEQTIELGEQTIELGEQTIELGEQTIELGEQTIDGGNEGCSRVTWSGHKLMSQFYKEKILSGIDAELPV